MTFEGLCISSGWGQNYTTLTVVLVRDRKFPLATVLKKVLYFLY
jgi:hypothetical protein